MYYMSYYPVTLTKPSLLYHRPTDSTRVAAGSVGLSYWYVVKEQPRTLVFSLVSSDPRCIYQTGELWNLEELSEKCKELKRHSFFLVSAPLNGE
jgi:hypothetical protein